MHHISWVSENFDATNTMGILEKDVNAMCDGIVGLEGTDDLFERAIIAAIRRL